MSKIVEIIPHLNSGGAERFVVDLSNGFTEKNQVIIVVLYSINNNWFYLKELSKNITVISLNKKQGFDVSIIPKLFKLLKNLRPNIVHIHLRGLDYALIPSLFLFNIKFFYTVHSDAYYDSNNLITRFYRWIFFKTRLIIPVTISNESRKSFQKAYGILPNMIFNGRAFTKLENVEKIEEEIKSYYKTSNTKVFLNVASIQPIKNQLMLAKVIKRLVEEGNDVILLIIGRNSCPAIIETINNLKCNNIYYLGEKEDPRLYMLFSDAICLSSIQEGMPITIIEAFSVGVMPICTPVGGIINMITDGFNGFLSKSFEENDYYDTLKRFLSFNNSYLQVIKKNCSDSISNYEMKKCVDNYLNLFERN